MDHEFPDDAVLITCLDIQIAKDAADDSPEKVDEKILHGVNETGIEISAVDDDIPAVFCLYDGLRDIAHGVGNLRMGRVQCDRRDVLYDEILLHVKPEELVAAEFKGL